MPTTENKDCIDIYCNKPLSWKIMVTSLRRRAIISALPLPIALSAECNLHYRTKTVFSKTLQGICDYNGVESFAKDSHFSGREASGLCLDKSFQVNKKSQKFTPLQRNSVALHGAILKNKGYPSFHSFIK